MSSNQIFGDSWTHTHTHKAVCISRVNALGKGINILSTLWVQSWTDLFFSLGKATSLGEGKLWIQISCTPLNKLTLCHILFVVEALGKYIQTMIRLRTEKLWKSFDSYEEKHGTDFDRLIIYKVKSIFVPNYPSHLFWYLIPSVTCIFYVEVWGQVSTHTNNQSPGTFFNTHTHTHTHTHTCIHEAVSVSIRANAFGKGMDPSVLPSYR